MRRAILFFAMLALLGAVVGPVSAAESDSAAKFASGGQFIVQFADLPVVAYDGSINGFKATKPAPGTKIDPQAADVTKYVGHLNQNHNQALQKSGGTKLYDYVYSYNGFLAKLTAKQANMLAADPNVLAVSPNELVNVDTSSTPSFLGLDAPGGLWSQLGGVTGNKNSISGAGDGIVIGVIDSGITPESLSFSDRDADGKLVYSQISPNSFHGKCDSQETTIDPSWDANLCNKKLISARHFNASWGGDAQLEADRPWEFQSPRDYNGHGTHTSSTAGGNNGVPTTGPSTFFGSSVSGMAPRARIAMYKALWSTQSGDTASGFNGDLVAAIDQAVADGVDVINYSISGTTTNFADPAQISFLFAADAGIFVSASAGNSGPTTGTVAHPGPWLTTVAAGTHNRNGSATLTLGNAATYTGASAASSSVTAPLIDSTAAGLPGADPASLALCFSASDPGGATLDPAKVAGKIVVCDRGVSARTNKSAAVLDAGGVGMVLVNTSPNSINADLHFVPSIHLQDTNRAAVKAYAATVNPTATISAATISFSEPAPFTAAFSSRGPLTAGGGDVLKPDLMAPGQDILAAVSPTPPNHGLSFNLYSGTSMSAPHVAGIAALIKQAHPSWSPMAVKSALMTTGTDVLDGPNTNPTVIFRQGAGHIAPNTATNPGLVYDAGFNDWLAFLCGTTTAVGPSTCTALQGLGYSLDPSDYNSASIAIGDMAGAQTVTRKVRNVGAVAATYTASFTGLPGVTAVASPPSLNLNPGQTGTFTVTFTRTTASLNAYVGGQMTLADGAGHNVRSPIVIRPVALAAPAQVTGTGAPINYTVKFGYTGSFTATGRGLVPATTANLTVTDDPTDNFNTANPGSNQGIVTFDVVVPAGSTYARFSTFNANTDGADDLDLYVYRLSTPNTLRGTSGGGTSDEQVNFVNPVADTYRIYVHGFATDGPDSNFTLFAWVLGSTSAGNMTVSAPSSATTGTTGAIQLTFSGLTPGVKYMGSVAYTGSVTLPNPTIVRVDP